MSSLIYWNRDYPQEFRKFFINETEKIKEITFLAIDDYYRLFSYYGLDLIEYLSDSELRYIVLRLAHPHTPYPRNIWTLIHEAISEVRS